MRVWCVRSDVSVWVVRVGGGMPLAVLAPLQSWSLSQLGGCVKAGVKNCPKRSPSAWEYSLHLLIWGAEGEGLRGRRGSPQPPCRGPWAPVISAPPPSLGQPTEQHLQWPSTQVWGSVPCGKVDRGPRVGASWSRWDFSSFLPTALMFNPCKRKWNQPKAGGFLGSKQHRCLCPEGPGVTRGCGVWGSGGRFGPSSRVAVYGHHCTWA